MWSSIIAAVEQEPLRIWRHIARKLGLSQPKCFRSTSWRSVCGAHFVLHTIAPDEWLHLHVAFEPLFAQQSVDMRSVCCAWGCFQRLKPSSLGSVVLMPSGNVLPASASTLGLVSLGPLSWAPTTYLTSWLLHGLVVIWKLFFSRGCLKIRM